MNDAKRSTIQIWTWYGLSPSVDTYDVSELDVALSQMRGSEPRDISIEHVAGCDLTASGHNGRFVLLFSREEGDENWHAETANPPFEQPLPLLVAGGQGADYPAEVRITFDELCEAAKWFAGNGDMSPSLTWIQD